MSILLISLGFICCIAGIVGSLLPVMPGLPVSWIGIVLLYFVPEVELSSSLLWITLGITIIIFILDYLIPLFGINRYGGSKYGLYGAGAGLVVGLLTPIPFDFLIFSFLGAYLGEVIFSKKESSKALRAAFGSFIGFLTSTFIEFMGAFAFMIIFCYKVIQYREFLF